MRLRSILVAAAAALALAACAGGPRAGAGRDRLPPPPEPVAPRAERLVLVALPGLEPAHYLPAPGAAPLARQIAALAESGVAVESVQPVFPPATLPALISLVTGRTPAGHGAVSWRALGDAGIGPPRPVPASAVQGETLWQAVSARGGAAAAFGWPGTEGSSVAQGLPLEAPVESGPARDAALVDAACALLGGPSPPRLLGIALGQAAVARQEAPPGSRAWQQALAGADAEVGRLVGCLRAAGLLATTALAVAGDHGALPVHTAIRPNVVLAEVGLVTTRREQVLSWRALARSNGGSAFVYAREPEDALLARRALEEAARTSGTFRVVSAEEMLARSADREAWFGLDAAPGWVFEDGVLGPDPAPARERSAGGYPLREPRMATGLVAWGAGLRAGVQVPELRQIDVAPTLARLLGVPLAGAEGRPLIGVLQP